MLPVLFLIKTKKMKVEIWSDIMCPFCYIGKRRFEKALSQFPRAEDVEIEWKSFQLNPEMKTDTNKNINQYLAEIKNWSLSQAQAMNDRVILMAEKEGLHYDFNKAIVANSFDAHRLIQYAKTVHKGDEAEERLFKAYFTEGKNISDGSVLIDLAEDIGLNRTEAEDVLKNNKFTENVNEDIREAAKIGVTGVPFFVFNRRYAVSGAQEAETFLDVLTKTTENQ
ncbi:MAG: DsbA family oxidoreductase [Bacteroidetes bacterium]|jgi:predicted DsbA family dithiol-disulfide isomerase|nr:DsbA family oxidoreductase [Bacteroidota bacterium]